MTPRLVFRPAAREDLRTARDWYDTQRPGLGTDLCQVVAAALERIADYPELFPEVEADIRRAVLSNFPYAIFYRIRPNDIEVLAAFHHRRDPVEWQARAEALSESQSTYSPINRDSPNVTMPMSPPST